MGSPKKIAKHIELSHPLTTIVSKNIFWHPKFANYLLFLKFGNNYCSVQLVLLHTTWSSGQWPLIHTYCQILFLAKEQPFPDTFSKILNCLSTIFAWSTTFDVSNGFNSSGASDKVNILGSIPWPLDAQPWTLSIDSSTTILELDTAWFGIST